MKKPLYWVRLDFNEFYRMVMAPKSDEELAAWIRDFSSTLFFGDGPCEYAKSLRSIASNEHEKYSESGAKGAEARWRKNAENGDANGEAIGEANSDPNGIREEKKREYKRTKKVLNIPFEDYLSSYPNDLQKITAERTWKKMTDEERVLAIGYLPSYISSLSDLKYCYGTNNYLLNKPWAKKQTAPAKTEEPWI